MTSSPRDNGADLDALRHYYEVIGPPSAPVLTAIRREVLTGTAVASRRYAASRRNLLLTAAAGGAAVVAVAAAGVLPLDGAGPPAGGIGGAAAGGVPDSLGAAATLELVANRTNQAPTVSLAGGRYVYTDYRAREVAKAATPGGLAWYLSEVAVRTWASADAMVPVRFVIQRGGAGKPLTPADAKKLAGYRYPVRTTEASTYHRPDGSPVRDPLSGARLDKPGPANPTPAYLASLPTDPRGLLAAVEATLPEGKPDPSGRRGAQQVFRAVAEMVGKADAILSPALRAALYRALALLPGMERVPGRVDLAGRTGIAVGRTDDGERLELIIDPGSSRVIGVRRVLLKARPGPGGPPAGTVLHWSTTDQRVVAEAGATS